MENNSNTWTAKSVADHFEEAVYTLCRLPPIKARGYFNLWPKVIYTESELLFQEVLPIRNYATNDAISRLEQTFEWMQWITVEERKIIWRRAARVPWKIISYEFRCERSTAWRKWVSACTKIATQLNVQESGAHLIKQFK